MLIFYLKQFLFNSLLIVTVVTLCYTNDRNSTPNLNIFKSLSPLENLEYVFLGPKTIESQDLILEITKTTVLDPATL